MMSLIISISNQKENSSIITEQEIIYIYNYYRKNTCEITHKFPAMHKPSRLGIY